MSSREITHDERMVLLGDHWERTFRILELAKREKGKGAETCLALNDCLPSGTRKDLLGATHKQIAYLGWLADLDDEQFALFVDTSSLGGGLSTWQAHHVIEKLKR